MALIFASQNHGALRLPTFSNHFNQPLAHDGFSFLLTLTHLDVGAEFKQLLGIDAWTPPPQPRSLTLASEWDLPME